MDFLNSDKSLEMSLANFLVDLANSFACVLELATSFLPLAVPFFLIAFIFFFAWSPVFDAVKKVNAEPIRPPNIKPFHHPLPFCLLCSDFLKVINLPFSSKLFLFPKYSP